MFQWISLVLSGLFLVGCANSGNSEQQLTHRKMRALSSQLKVKERQVESLKAKNEILQGLKKRKSLAQRARVDLSKMSEKQAYTELLKIYKKNDENSLRISAKSFIKKYPKSKFNDNIYYMMGSLKLKGKDYVKSIKYFDKVEKSYARQDKAPYAIYAKGLVYKKLGLHKQAKLSFEKVVSKYSKSGVADKAIQELKGIVK